MSTLFARHYAYSSWDPEELSGPCPTLTLREWEVSVILCSLPPAVQQVLSDWLIAPTDHRWLRLAPAPINEPDAFTRHLAAFGVGELCQPVDTLCFVHSLGQRCMPFARRWICPTRRCTASPAIHCWLRMVRGCAS